MWRTGTYTFTVDLLYVSHMFLSQFVDNCSFVVSFSPKGENFVKVNVIIVCVGSRPRKVNRKYRYIPLSHPLRALLTLCH